MIMRIQAVCKTKGLRGTGVRITATFMTTNQIIPKFLVSFSQEMANNFGNKTQL